MGLALFTPSAVSLYTFTDLLSNYSKCTYRCADLCTLSHMFVVREAQSVYCDAPNRIEGLRVGSRPERAMAEFSSSEHDGCRQILGLAAPILPSRSEQQKPEFFTNPIRST